MSDLPSSFDFAKEVTTQLLTLATAVVSISVTFAKEISPRAVKNARRRLYQSWICFLGSICFGIWVLCAITGKLAEGDPEPDTVYALSIRLPSILQILAFVGGILCLVLHAIRSQPQSE